MFDLLISLSGNCVWIIWFFGIFFLVLCCFWFNKFNKVFSIHSMIIIHMDFLYLMIVTGTNRRNYIWNWNYPKCFVWETPIRWFFFFFFKKMITTPTRLGFVGWFSNLIGFFVVGVVESLLCQAAKKCTHIEISQRRRQKRSIYQRKKTNKQLNNNKIDDDKSQIQKNRQKE